MSARNLRNRMGEAHEAHIQSVFGGRRTRGSGNQWRDQTDVRMDHREEAVAFAFDGKSTRAKSSTITRADLDKLVQQSAELRPCLAVRFYEDDRLKLAEDWYLVAEDDLLELIERSRLLSAVEEFVGADAMAAFRAQVA